MFAYFRLCFSKILSDMQFILLGYIRGAYHPECGRVLLRILFSFTKYNFILNQLVILRGWIHEGFSFVFLDRIKLEFILFPSDGVIDVHSGLFSLR